MRGALNPYEAPATDVDPGPQPAPWADIERERLLPTERRIKGIGVLCYAWLLGLSPICLRSCLATAAASLGPRHAERTREIFGWLALNWWWLLGFLLLASGWNLVRLRRSGRLLLVASVLLDVPACGLLLTQAHSPYALQEQLIGVALTLLMAAGAPFLWTSEADAVLSARYREEVVEQTAALNERLPWYVWLGAVCSTAVLGLLSLIQI